MKKTILILLIVVSVISQLGVAAKEFPVPELYYNFDSIAAGNAIDVSGNNKDAMIYGSAMLTSGIKGGGLYLNGSDAHLAIDSTNIEHSSNFTYSLWVKPRFSKSGTESILSFGDKFEITMDNRTKKLTLTVLSSSITADYILEKDTWYHLTLIRESNSYYLYINENQVANLTKVGSVNDSNTSLLIGSNGIEFFCGSIDEIKHYTTNISLETIKEEYLSIMNDITSWNNVSYPDSSTFPNGINPAQSGLFRNSNLIKPINTGFEERNEINALQSKENNETSISEDKYEGKFSLQLNQKSDRILPIKESKYFKIGMANIIDTKNNIEIATEKQNIIVSGNAKENALLELFVYDEKGKVITNEVTCLDDGSFLEEIAVSSYGLYDIIVKHGDIELFSGKANVTDDTTDTNNNVADIENVDTKCNQIYLMLKPMYKAKNISFYTKVFVKKENGAIEEEFALIKSDKNKDGVFIIGEDIALGRWQKINLNLLDIDETPFNGIASGLYVSSNINSSWLIDGISSGYKKINENTFDLGLFADRNVVYDENLQFDLIDENKFDTAPQVVAGGLDVDEKITGFKIDSSKEYVSNTEETSNKGRTVLLNTEFSSEQWSVNDENYDTATSGVGRKVDAIYKRQTLPNVTGTTYTINIDDSRESKIRLIYNTSVYALTVIDKEGNQYPYSYGISCTDWFESDITISVSGYSLASYFTLIAIEYVPKNEEQISELDKVIELKYNGSASLNAGDFSTDDRTVVAFDLENIISANTTTVYNLQLALYEGESTEAYYIAKQNFYQKYENQQIDFVVPKIRPNSKIEITNLANNRYTINLIDFKIMSLLDSDIYVGKQYYGNVSSTTYYTECLNKDGYAKISDWANEDALYAVKNKEAVGKIFTATASGSFNGKVYVYRFVNLSDNPVAIYYNNTSYWLPYGEAEMAFSSAFTIPNGVMVISITTYETISSNNNNVSYLSVEGIGSIYQISQSGDNIYYANYYDNKCLYKYNIPSDTYTKLTDASISGVNVSPDETLYSTWELETSNMYFIYNTVKNTREQVNFLYRFNMQNEAFAVSSGVLYTYDDGASVPIINIADYESIATTITSFAFDKSGNYLILGWYRASKSYGMCLLERSGSGWILKKSFANTVAYSYLHISPDISRIYATRVIADPPTTTTTVFDINTGEELTAPLSGYVLYSDKDDMIVYADNCHYLYYPTTDERKKLFLKDTYEYKNMIYNEETGMLTYITESNTIGRIRIDTEPTTEKYLLSFDGQKTWHAFSDGRWITASNSKTPSETEMLANGMTAEQVNAISQSEINKMYTDGDIISVNVAIYMTSKSTQVSPVIESIKVYTLDKTDLSGMYDINIEKFNKDDYKSISSIFPVERLNADAECYYLLYLGNDWLYTYKDGKTVKVVESADELLGDIENGWISFKQYGMTAKELRNIPEEELTSLLVNENYANTEFGVIYVIKTKDDTLSENSVTFKMHTQSKFIAGDDIVVEIVMNGNDIKVIDSAEFSVQQISDFMSWIEQRQNGKGSIFYQLKNDKVQYFINYYMINSINVYDGADYRTTSEQEEATEASSEEI